VVVRWPFPSLPFPFSTGDSSTSKPAPSTYTVIRSAEWPRDKKGIRPEAKRSPSYAPGRFTSRDPGKGTKRPQRAPRISPDRIVLILPDRGHAVDWTPTTTSQRSVGESNFPGRRLWAKQFQEPSREPLLFGKPGAPP
jgi:hypothetical protein